MPYVSLELLRNPRGQGLITIVIVVATGAASASPIVLADILLSL